MTTAARPPEPLLPPLLSLDGLSVSLDGAPVLRAIDLTVAAAERVALVGPSGSGKTTLARVLCAELAPSAGRVRLRGAPLTRAAPEVALVPQNPADALDPFRRLSFHWRQAERALGLAPDPLRRDRLMGRLGLAGADLARRPWEWSRGMQQRFVIALALLGRPGLVIMDEPSSALDPTIAAQTLRLTQEMLAETGAALLLITHDLGLALAQTDRVLVMEAGRLVEDAPGPALLAAPRSAAARRLIDHRCWAHLPC